MSVSRVGSISTVQSSANSGSQSVTVPLDCDYALISITGWVSVGDALLTGASISLAGAAATYLHHHVDGDGNLTAIYGVGLVDSGSQTFAWDLAGSTTFGDGGQWRIIYLSGGNISDPIRSTGQDDVASDPNPGGPVEATGMLVFDGDYLYCTAYVASTNSTSTFTPTWGDAIALDNDVFNLSANIIGEGSPSTDINPSLEANASLGGNLHIVLAAIVIKQAGDPPQSLRPDSDIDAGTWASTPLWSKVDEESADGTVITEST